MPKIPDFSKFDLQSIVNSVKSIINPEIGTPNVSEGDPIGAKIVAISTLLQNVVNAHAQSAKDLTQINNSLNELYKDLESFRKLESEFRQKQSEKFTEEQTTAHPKETVTHTETTTVSKEPKSGKGSSTPDDKRE